MASYINKIELKDVVKDVCVNKSIFMKTFKNNMIIYGDITVDQLNEINVHNYNQNIALMNKNVTLNGSIVSII